MVLSKADTIYTSVVMHCIDCRCSALWISYRFICFTFRFPLSVIALFVCWLQSLHPPSATRIGHLQARKLKCQQHPFVFILFLSRFYISVL